MTPEVEAELRKSGWYPGRRVDDAQVNEWLRIGVRDLGCRIFPEAVRFLREYGGLVWQGFDLAPEDGGWGWDKIGWLHWEWQFNEVLFPIAYALGESDFMYAISSTGKFYGNDSLYCGASSEEFFDRRNWRFHMPADWGKDVDEEIDRMYAAVYES